MPNEKITEMTQEIYAFIKKFEKKYGQYIEITVGVDESGIFNSKDTLKGLETFAILHMHQNEPSLWKYKNFNHRCRKLNFMRYSQAFQYIAHNLGYKKVKIANIIDRNHATVINSIRQSENYLFWGNQQFIDIYYPLLSKILTYVGSLSNNVKRQTFTKPVFTSFSNSEKNIRSNDQPTFGAKGTIQK